MEPSPEQSQCRPGRRKAGKSAERAVTAQDARAARLDAESKVTHVVRAGGNAGPHLRLEMAKSLEMALGGQSWPPAASLNLGFKVPRNRCLRGFAIRRQQTRQLCNVDLGLLVDAFAVAERLKAIKAMIGAHA